MSAPTVYFVTGANRGIGFAFVNSLAQRDDVLIFAGARDPSKADKLNALAKEKEGKIVVVKLEVTSDDDAQKAAETVKEKSSKVDVLIANAGIGLGFGPAHQLDPKDLQTVIDVNVGGPLRIYKALYPLLIASPSPRVIGVSSTLGSIATNADPAQIGPYQGGSYSISKTALNMLFARIHTENHKEHNMTAFVVCPGHAQTDMGSAGAQAFGMEEAPVKVEDSIKGLLGFIDDETKQYAGRFMSYDGAERPW
ncbi:hypothetical protein JCM10908_006857 [Rhodotorula pacifica]|uniref:SDR family oxidoreductase n=1 Tax=Rhodotorula pacifica TaxID=1495444 RepID=UPI0031799FFF